MTNASLKAVVVASVFVSGLTVSSCNVTDLQPASSLTSTQFYKTQDDAQAAIISIYSRMTDQDAVVRPYYWGEARADQTSPAASWGQDSEVRNAKIQQLDPNYNLADWSPTYSVIQRCNDALKGIETIPTDITFPVPTKDALLGEAAILRAHAYFHLVRTFGGVPLVLDPSDRVNKDYLVPQSSEQEVLDQIEKDLNFAIGKMPKPAQSADARRRATRGAAKALLVHAKLWRNDYQGALTIANDLINNEGYTLEPAASYMNQFWNQGGTNEVIFTLGYNNVKRNWIIDKMSSEGGSFGVVPAGDWVAKYRAAGEPVRGNTRTFLYLGPGNGANYVLKYQGNPGANPNGPVWGLNYIVAADVPRDFVVLRLADIYLLRAEARNRLNDRAGALEDLNRIRQRANMAVYAAADLNTVEKVEDAILAERDIELSFEGQRWYDIVRVGRHGRDEVVYTQATNLLSAVQKPAAQAFLRDKKAAGSWLMPVNQRNLANNPNLKQLDAYKQ